MEEHEDSFRLVEDHLERCDAAEQRLELLVAAVKVKDDRIHTLEEELRAVQSKLKESLRLAQENDEKLHSLESRVNIMTEGGGVRNARRDEDRTCVDDETVVSRLMAELLELLRTVVRLARTGNGSSN